MVEPQNSSQKVQNFGPRKSENDEDFLACKKPKNKERCNCTFSCEKKGACCDCLEYHLKNRELPACCFPEDVEKIGNRSFEKFSELVKEGKV